MDNYQGYTLGYENSFIGMGKIVYFIWLHTT